MNVEGIRSRAHAVSITGVKWLRSERFFYVIIALLGLQAVWFALSARYPMAFDENFHFGLIQLHTNQWLPFFTNQPAHADIYGPVARDPSYLYHFLLSVPYRLITLFTYNQAVQVIILRFINIALALGAVILARRVLFRLGISRALSHASLLLFALVPIVPFLFAHINYDNLFFLVLIWTLLLTFDWLDALKRHQVSLSQTITLLSLLALGCLVKYPFLPVAVAIAVVMAWRLFKVRGSLPKIWQVSPGKFLKQPV